MSTGYATIDGQLVSVGPGDTILDAARRCDVDIPTLCHCDGLAPEGSCRLCVVQTGDEGKIEAACHTAITPGMRVRTMTPLLHDLRRDILSLIANQHGDRLTADADGNEYERLLAQVGTNGGNNGSAKSDAVDDSHPYIRFDPSLCVECRRCLNVCEQVQGQFVYGIEGRGERATLKFGDGSFVDSDCVSCGACVDVCPTTAVIDRDRMNGQVADTVTDSVCGYCGVGCRVRVESKDNVVLRINGVPDAQVNHGHLCVKGRFAHAYHHDPDRLTQPLLRDGDEFRPVDWDTAIDWVTKRLTEIRDEHGPDSLAAITSSRSTNEAAYLLQKLFRTTIGTNNVDCCARVCHSSTALGLQLVTGTGAASASYDDIERAKCIVVAGANATEAHPVTGARIKQAALNGTPLIVIDPRRIELAEFADVHLQLRPGTNVALFNAMAKVMIDNEWYDRQYIEERCEGFEELAEFAEEVSLTQASEDTSVSVDAIHRAAELLRHNPTLFVHGLGLSELTQGTASVMTLCMLGMLTGSIGIPGAGMLPLRGQNNVQGNADMGGMPNQVTGYQPVGDENVRERLEKEWGKLPPTHAGITIPEMFDAAADGKLRGLWIQGEDVAQSDANQNHVIAALQKLDLLVIQDLFMTGTARYAHLILPAASALEQEGTFTNGERRIQWVRPAVKAPGESRPDWRVAIDVANAMGEDWSYDSPAEVMDEIARVAPRLFGGFSYDRLEGDGIQWPCPNRDHPGTTCVHADGFLRGKGQLVSIDYEPSPEQASGQFPYVLITGRVLEHYNVGNMTRRSPNLQLVATDQLEIHPDDAAAIGVAEDEPVHLESRWGETDAPAHLTSRVSRGTLFLSFHDPDRHTNCLTSPYVDPQSKCPEYKVTAVNITKS